MPKLYVPGVTSAACRFTGVPNGEGETVPPLQVWGAAPVHEIVALPVNPSKDFTTTGNVALLPTFTVCVNGSTLREKSTVAGCHNSDIPFFSGVGSAGLKKKGTRLNCVPAVGPIWIPTLAEPPPETSTNVFTISTSM